MRSLRAGWRLARMDVVLAMRTPAAMFFTFAFPLIFLFAYGALFAQGSPRMVEFLFGPVVVLQMLSSTFFGLGIRTVAMRERGALRRYRLAPVGPGVMIVGSMIANLLLLIPTVVLLFVCARLAFQMPLAVNWGEIVILVLVGDFALAGFGLVIGAVAETMQEAQVFSNAAFFPLLFLSGATIPLAALPHWLQRVAAFLPPTYLVAGFQQAMGGGGRGALRPGQIAALVIAGAFGLMAAAQLFRWDKEERLPARRKLGAAALVVPFLLMGAWMNAQPSGFAAWGQALAAASPSGQAAPRKAANQPVTSPAAAPVKLSEFDAVGGAPGSAFGAGWKAVSDAILGGESQAEMQVVAGGPPGSRSSLLITGAVRPGAPQPWAGAVFFPGSMPWAPADLSRWTTISFWARGDGSYALVLMLAGRRGDPAVAPFRAGPQWSKIQISLSHLAPRRRQAEGLIFAAGTPGPFRLRIDRVWLR